MQVRSSQKILIYTFLGLIVVIQRKSGVTEVDEIV